MRDKTSWKLFWKRKSGWKSGDDKGNWQIWQIMWRFAVMDVSTRKRKTCLALSGSQESSMEGDPPKTSTQKSILSVIINQDNQNHENYCWYDGIQEYAGMCFCQDDNKGYDDEKCWKLIWWSKWWLRWWGWRWWQMWGQALRGLGANMSPSLAALKYLSTQWSIFPFMEEHTKILLFSF